jgi:hypothetical protein
MIIVFGPLIFTTSTDRWENPMGRAALGMGLQPQNTLFLNRFYGFKTQFSYVTS